MTAERYSDIVTFLNANENATERHKGLSVNLVEVYWLFCFVLCYFIFVWSLLDQDSLLRSLALLFL